MWYTTANNKRASAALQTPRSMAVTFTGGISMATLPQTWYVYVLARPNGKPFYVGKGKNRRVFRHDTEARSGCDCHRCNVIRKIWRSGGEVQRYIIFTTNLEQEAFDYEVETIALYGRKNLTNQSDGGGARSNPTADARARMSAARSQRRASEATRARISASKKGTKASPETRAKLSAAQKLSHRTPEFRAKQSAILRSVWADPEKRSQKAARYRTPEFRAKVSASKAAPYADPEFRARQRAIRSTPEFRAKISASNKAAWARRKQLKEQS